MSQALGCSAPRRTFAAIALAALAAVVSIGVADVPAQPPKLVAGDPADGEVFGGSIAVDGDTMLVGAESLFTGAPRAAYVFARTGSNWTQQARLTVADAAYQDHFGSSVALAGDTAVAAARSVNPSGGAACVFIRTGTSWTEQAILTASDGVSAGDFGSSIAISGETLIVGARGGDGWRGAAYVFTRTGATWTQQAKLSIADAAVGDGLGAAVALSGDTAVIGRYGTNSLTGLAYVFVRTGTTWTQQATLAAADTTSSAHFGTCVAVSGDTTVVGAYGQDGGLGAAYVFTRTGNAWTQQAKLTAAGAWWNTYFGRSVGLVGDTAVVAAENRGLLDPRGAVYAFTRTGTIWTQTSNIASVDSADVVRFGTSLAFSGDTLAVGAFDRDMQQGAAYVLTGVGPRRGYCVPTKVSARVHSAHPEKSTLAASGTFDTGIGVQDFSGAATFDVGGFHVDVPAFVRKGSSLVHRGSGVTLSIRPARSASSRATFRIKLVGDVSNNVDLDGELLLKFTNTAHSLSGAADLTAGTLAPLGVSSPVLHLLGAAAALRGPGHDALTLTMGFASGGTAAPYGPEDLTIRFGDTYTAAIPATAFVRKGKDLSFVDAQVFAAKAPGITRATVDYVKGTITVHGSGIDLGPFAEGGNSVVVTITRGTDVRSVAIRMNRQGTKLTY